MRAPHVFCFLVIALLCVVGGCGRMDTQPTYSNQRMILEELRAIRRVLEKQADKPACDGSCCKCKPEAPEELPPPKPGPGPAIPVPKPTPKQTLPPCPKVSR